MDTYSINAQQIQNLKETVYDHIKRHLKENQT